MKYEYNLIPFDGKKEAKNDLPNKMKIFLMMKYRDRRWKKEKKEKAFEWIDGKGVMVENEDPKASCPNSFTVTKALENSINQ